MRDALTELALNPTTSRRAYQIGDLAFEHLEGTAYDVTNPGALIGSPWVATTAGTSTQYHRHGERFAAWPKPTLSSALGRDEVARLGSARHAHPSRRPWRVPAAERRAPERGGGRQRSCAAVAHAVRANADCSAGRRAEPELADGARVVRYNDVQDVMAGVGPAAVLLAQADGNFNIPIDPDEFYQGLANPDVPVNDLANPNPAAQQGPVVAFNGGSRLSTAVRAAAGWQPSRQGTTPVRRAHKRLRDGSTISVSLGEVEPFPIIRANQLQSQPPLPDVRVAGGASTSSGRTRPRMCSCRCRTTTFTRTHRVSGVRTASWRSMPPEAKRQARPS